MIVDNKKKIEEKKDNSVKLIAYKGDSSSCFGNRLYFPLSILGTNHKDDFAIAIDGKMDLRHEGIYDLVILQRQYYSSVYEGAIKFKKHGAKLVYETDDDLFSVPEWSSAHKTFGKKVVQDNIKAFLSQVDAVFTTTEYLAKVYSQYCKKVYVLPNSIVFDIFYPPPRNNKRSVVLWQGSYTHQKDLAIMGKSIKKLTQDSDVLVKMWYSDEFKNTYNVPFVPYQAFYPMLAQLDATVGLAPLTSHPFNRSKSNLKWLEYSASGIPVIASNFGPYAESIEHDKTGILISDNRDWYEATRNIIDNPDKALELVKNSMEVIKEKYDMKKNYKLWGKAICEILGRDDLLKNFEEVKDKE